MIRVVLADDHPVVREGLRAVITAEGDVEVVAEADTGRQAIAEARRWRPDLVVTDLRMPDQDGVEVIVELARTDPDLRVLVLTTYDTDDLIVASVEAGAVGFLLKDTPPDELRTAVRQAAAGQTVLSPPVAARLVARLQAPKHDDLTRRELEILRLVAAGRGNAEIAAELHVSRATVKTHLLHVYDKLGVSDRTAAVAVAYDRKILGR